MLVAHHGTSFANGCTHLNKKPLVALPALADFKLDIPPELSASTQDFHALVTEVKMIERDGALLLLYALYFASCCSCNPP